MARQAQYTPIFFAPDMDPSWSVNPGVLTDVRNLVPTVSGTLANYCSTPDDNLRGITALVSAKVPNTAKIMKRIGFGSGSDSARFFIGADDTLYEVNRTSGLIVDVSKSAGAYTASEWAFDTFGDTMLAAARTTGGAPTQPVQASTGVAGTAFADLAGSLRSGIVVVQRGFVVAYDIHDGLAYYNDGWACSGQNNPTSWVANFTAPANVATQANYGRAYDSPGGWRAAYRMRDGIAAYKADAIYIARYTGPITASSPNTWSHTIVSDKVGVANHNAVAILNGVHYFIHRSGVYRFDGSYPQNIGHGRVNAWLAERMSRATLYDNPGIRSYVDEARGMIFWYLGTNQVAGALSINAALVYNVVSDRFGWVDRPWNDIAASDPSLCCPVQASSTDRRSWWINADGARQYSMLTVGSIGGSIYVRGVNLGGQARSINTDATLYTGDLGDDINFARVDGIKVRLLKGDDDSVAAQASVDVKDSEGDYYNHSGLQIMATATATGAGGCRIIATVPGLNPRVILATDVLAFSATLLQGSIATPVGVRITFTDASFVDAPAAIVALDRWVTVTASLAAHAGKTYSSIAFYFGAPAALGVHQALIRNVRITDAGGVVAQRVYDLEDRIYTMVLALLSNFTLPFPYLNDVESIGRAFTYDTRRRRFQGNVTGRLARLRLTVNNKAELGGIYVHIAAAEGTE